MNERGIVRSRRLPRRALRVALVSASFLGVASAARAGDSPSECTAERAAWLDRAARADFDEAAVHASMGDGIANSLLFGIAALVPAVGLEIERGHALPAASLAWSVSRPFGPVTACSTARYSGDLYELRSLRATIEGGVVIRSRPWEYLRPGLRAIWHRTAWPLGVGAGLGTTLALMPEQQGAASVSPELLLHYGRCCGFGYGLLTLRADVFFPSRYPTTATASLGFAVW